MFSKIQLPNNHFYFLKERTWKFPEPVLLILSSKYLKMIKKKKFYHIPGFPL